MNILKQKAKIRTAVALSAAFTLNQVIAINDACAQSRPPEPRIGVAWGFLYGYMGAPAPTYMPELRSMGSGFSKVYLFWNQIEPKQGEFDFTAVDAYVNQLQSPGEGLIAIFSTSKWATHKSMELLPPSPPRDLRDYYKFIYTLVSHCKGKVKYWQNDCEPNNPIYWAGTPTEFVESLKVFYRAVKDADPDAVVVAGGYDGLFNPPGTWEFPTQAAGLAFFDRVLKDAKDSFDVFDLRLYGNVYTIDYRVQFIRNKMLTLGYEKPIICTEYNGPGFFEMPANRAYIPIVAEWSQQVAQGKLPTSENNPIAELYKKMNTLAPQTQMFMTGCPPELEQKFYRIQGRDMVMRVVFALGANVQRTLFWDLSHDVSNRDDIMQLMYSKQRMMEYRGEEFFKLPPAETFKRLATMLQGVTTVRRVAGTAPDLYGFSVERTNRPKMLILWQQRDAFSGEDQPPQPFVIPWKGTEKVNAIDAFGISVDASVQFDTLRIALTHTPCFVEAD